jgi:electron transfer flavoprotein alpha subunit
VADHPTLKHKYIKNLNLSFGDAMENVLKTIIEKNKYTHVVTPSSSEGKEIIPRVAVNLDCQPLTDVTKIMVIRKSFIKG